MKRKWRSMLTAAVLCATGTTALSADEDRLTAAFSVADRDANGAVNVDEYVAYFVAAFRALDDEGKGHLVASDFERFDPARFAAADRDGDGRISLGEAVAERMTLFFDLAGSDGVITLKELLVYENAR